MLGAKTWDTDSRDTARGMRGRADDTLRGLFSALKGSAGLPPMDTPAAAQTPAEHELAELIVQSLNIDWVKPEAIAPDAALFGGDLGLDSIDALELALAISKRYGFQLRSDNPDNKRIFGSLRALADHVQQQRVA
jgi:acyl carrier protein